MASVEEIVATPIDVAPTFEQRLARARAEKAKREEREAAEKAAAELERFELVERFEKEFGGREGRTFAIVDATDLGEGFVVVRLGEGVLWKAFAASKMNVVDTEAFVLPCVVHPTKDLYRELVMRRGFIADRCATALAGLYGVKGKEDQGK